MKRQMKGKDNGKGSKTSNRQVVKINPNERRKEEEENTNKGGENKITKGDREK